MATASSYASDLRRTSSSVTALKNGNLKTTAVLVPKLRSTLVMAPSRPAMMEPTPIMVPVPMMTPSTVRKERILCSRTVFSASPMAEPNSTMVIYEAPSSFHPQCFDGIQLGGLLRRIDSEEKAHHHGQRYADDYR